MIQIKAEKTKYHRFTMYFDYDVEVLDLCRALKESYGWQRFSFNAEGDLKRWVFSEVIFIKLIMDRFNDTKGVIIDSNVQHIYRSEMPVITMAQESHKATVEIKEKKDTDFVVGGIKGELYPYQKVGVEFLLAANGRAIVADPPGMGKSLQALGFATHKKFGRTLVVCPASVKSSWEKEIKKWTNLKYVIIDSKTDISKIPSDKQVWVINYDILRKHFEQLMKTRFDLCVADECVVPETMIATQAGHKQIKDIIPGEMVLSFNESTRKAEYKKVVKVHVNQRNGRDIVAVGNLHCTADHRIYDGKNYVEADNVKNTFPIQRPGLKVGTSEEVLCGTLMGDASLMKNPPQAGRPNNISPRLRVGHSVRHKDLLLLKAHTIKYFDQQKVETVWNAGYKPDWYVRVCSRALPELHMYFNELYEYINGKKVNKVSEYFLANMGVPGLAVWLQDDGTVNRGGITLCSYRYGLEGNRRLKRWFKETYGTTCSIHQDKKRDGRVFYGLRFKNEESMKLYTLVRDYIVPSMYKKFDWLETKFMYLPPNHCLTCGKRVVAQMRNKKSQYCSRRCYNDSGNKTQKIKPYIPETVYDLEIEDNHNYFADGILIHNCHYVKSPTATRTKVLRQLAKTIPHVVLLSGTPLLSRPVEMFTLLNMIDPMAWNNYYTFTRQYCGGKQGRWGWDASGATNTEELHDKIKKYFIRRKKEEVLSQLPPKNRIDVPVTFPDDIASEYELAENNLIAYLREYAGKQPAEIARAVQAEKLAQLNVLRQLCAFGKLSAAEEIIESVLEADEKILVFSSFVEPLQILKDKLKDKAVMITGKTNVDDRGDIVDKFQTDPEVKVFLGGVKSAGVGITLTAAQNVLFLDYAWNPADMQQAEDRIHRPGQQASSVNIYQLHVEGTIDGKLKGILEKKQKIFDSVVEGIVPDESGDTMKAVVDDMMERRGAKWAPMDLSK